MAKSASHVKRDRSINRPAGWYTCQELVVRRTQIKIVSQFGHMRYTSNATVEAVQRSKDTTVPANFHQCLTVWSKEYERLKVTDRVNDALRVYIGHHLMNHSHRQLSERQHTDQKLSNQRNVREHLWDRWILVVNGLDQWCPNAFRVRHQVID
uniref:Uncharacterized protein n=1 Tax=Anopheles merus TaxID=30066 RepID=A0A182UYN5_ANOME